MEKTIPSFSFHSTAETLKAIAHPERLAILSLLSKAPQGRLTVKRIYDSLGLLQPVASRHLVILKSAGVVKRTKEKQKIFYALCITKKLVAMLTEAGADRPLLNNLKAPNHD